MRYADGTAGTCAKTAPPPSPTSPSPTSGSTAPAGTPGNGATTPATNRAPTPARPDRSLVATCHDARVFIERVIAPRDEFELWDARLRMLTEPPPALVASIAWETDGEVTCIN